MQGENLGEQCSLNTHKKKNNLQSTNTQTQPKRKWTKIEKNKTVQLGIMCTKNIYTMEMINDNTAAQSTNIDTERK